MYNILLDTVKLLRIRNIDVLVDTSTYNKIMPGLFPGTLFIVRLTKDETLSMLVSNDEIKEKGAKETANMIVERILSTYESMYS